MTERVIRIVLDDDQATAGLNRLDQGLGRVDKGATRTRASFRGLAAAASAVVAALGVKEFVSYGDELIRLQNRLGTVTDGTQNLAAVQAELVELSFRTRTSFEDNVELFTRTAAATENLGLSQRAVIELTESLSIGLRIGGATAAEASGALTQFTQGLALGRFETQELKSVLEQSVPVSRALQKEFKATQGQLLELAENGELSAERVVKALRGDTLKEFREQLANLTPTAEEGFGQLTRAIKLSLGELNTGIGLSEGLGKTFNDMAISIADSTIEMFEFGKAVTETLTIAIGIVDLTIAKIDTLGEEMALSIAEAREESGFLDAALRTVAEASDAANEAISDLPTGASEVTRFLASPLLVAGDAARLLEADTRSVSEAEDELADSLSNQSTILEGLVALETKFAADRAQRVKDREAARVSDDEDEGDGATGLPDDKQIKDATEFLADLTEEIARAKIETENFGLEAEAALLRFESAQNIEENAGAMADEINNATEALIEQNAALARQEEIRENQKSDADFIASLQAEADTIVLQNEERLLAINLAELSADAKENEIEQVKRLTEAIEDGDREDFIESLRDELELIRLADEEREIEIALRQLGANATEAQKAEVIGLVKELEKERGELADLAAGIERFSENVGTALAETLFDGMRDGFDDIEDEFANFLQNLAKQLLASQLQDLISGLLTSIGGGGGFFGAAVNAIGGGQRAGGGEVTRGVPFIVGENRPEVFVPSESGNVLPDAGSGLGMAPVIQNILDPANQLSLIETAQGRNVIRNTIQGDIEFYERILGQT